jgi:hypothetical protein
MNQPFRITIEHYDQRVCVEVDHSDVSAAEAVELFQRAMRAAGFDYVNVCIDNEGGDVNHDVDADHDAYIAAADALLGGNIAREFLNHDPVANIDYKAKRGEIVEVSNDLFDWETRVFDWSNGRIYFVPATYEDEVKMHDGGKDYPTDWFRYCRKLDGEMFSYT